MARALARENEMEDAAEDVAVTPSPSASSWTEVDEVGAVFCDHFDVFIYDSNWPILAAKLPKFIFKKKNA